MIHVTEMGPRAVKWMNEGRDTVILDWRIVEPSSYQYPQGRWGALVRGIGRSVAVWRLTPAWLYPTSSELRSQGDHNG